MKRVGIVVAVALLSAGIARADFQAGLQAFNDKDFTKAVTTWTADAAKGDLNSQYNLGLLFEKGVEGYPKDLPKAYGWYRVAASQNAEAAKKAIDRIKPLMTAGQIDSGNNFAIERFGKWFRQNIGRDEQDYQAAKIQQKKARKAKIEIERKAAAARAQRQRDLISERDADAKLADQLQKESRKAAIRAAQEKAEEAKRNAFIEKRRREEEARMAALREEKNRQAKLDSARSRLAELQAKQQGGQAQQIIAPTAKAEPAPVVQSAPAVVKEVAQVPAKTPAPAPVIAPAPAPMKTQAPVPKVIAAPVAVIASKPVAVPSAKAPAKASQVPAKAAVTEKPVQKEQTKKKQVTPASAPEPLKMQPEKIAESKPAEAVQKKPEPVKEVASAPKKEIPQAEPKKEAVVASKPAVAEPTTVAAKKPFKAIAAPSEAGVAIKPVLKQKVSLPVMTNGLDVVTMKEIVEKANSVSLDTAAAKQEIEAARTDIESLKWTLISAARGKGSAKRMSVILEERMNVVQIAEANRRAAEWIAKRQKRQ